MTFQEGDRVVLRPGRHLIEGVVVGPAEPCRIMLLTDWSIHEVPSGRLVPAPPRWAIGERVWSMGHHGTIVAISGRLEYQIQFDRWADPPLIPECDVHPPLAQIPPDAPKPRFPGDTPVVLPGGAEGGVSRIIWNHMARCWEYLVFCPAIGYEIALGERDIARHQKKVDDTCSN